MIIIIAIASLALAGSNTNRCMMQLEAISICLSTGARDRTCCLNYRKFNDDLCPCNPLIGSLANGAQSFPILQKLSKACSNPVLVCPAVGSKTYYGGVCPIDDASLDAARVYNAKSLTEMLLKLGDNVPCFDYLKFKEALSTVVQPDVIGRAGYGLGIYEGLGHVAEYLSLLSPVVTKGFLGLERSLTPNPTLYIAPSGTSISLGNTVTNIYIDRSMIRNTEDYLETKFIYKGCDTKPSEIEFPAASALLLGKTTGVRSLAETVYKLLAVGSDALGIKSICKQHSKFCTKFPQFASETECIKYLKSLPVISPTCGKAALLSGNTSTCRAKHQFMVQMNPSVHCPHLGRKSEVCDDNYCPMPGNPFQIDTDSTDAVRVYSTKKDFWANYAATWQYGGVCPI